MTVTKNIATAKGRTPVQGKNKRLGTSILLQVLAMIGVGVFVYSSAADWFSRLNHNAEISGYTQAVTTKDAQFITESLRLAREYNSHMPQGMLRDPYSTQTPAPETEDNAYKLYERLLSLKDVTGAGTAVIGEVKYDRLGINLPIYHGTSNEVLTKGVGHLYGSSLPVGGPSTHSVLTTHSGLVHASLFTDLPKANLGDTFTVQVLGETHWYRVDNIETVLPEETERLKIVNNEDYVTLITCTPIGINSHRLLVRGERIDAPPVDTSPHAIAGDGKTAGTPWWAIIFIGASGTITYLIFAPVKPRIKKKGDAR